jgi:protein-L-isoaspartate(D-aspartate) O-methyltransferase
MMLSRIRSALLRYPPGLLRSGLLVMLSLLTRDQASAVPLERSYAQERAQMVSEQIEARGIHDVRVLDSLRKVPRHLLVPEAVRASAYEDRPLPIGHEQTISQPYIVALMTQLARPQPTDRVLEVGTGSGYQAAVLANLVAHVYTIELEDALALRAAESLRQLSYDNVTVRSGDGYVGWPEKAPFDIIIVTAAPDHVPRPLLDQLAAGGRMIVPVGATSSTQELQLIEKDASGKSTTTTIELVRFVPLRRAQ